MRVSVFVSSSARLHHGLYIALGIEEICKNAESNSINRFESPYKKVRNAGYYCSSARSRAHYYFATNSLPVAGVFEIIEAPKEVNGGRY
jgi:hypothetical protein